MIELSNPYDNMPVNLHGPNMLDYDETVRNYRFSIPEEFNFGFDVIDRWAEDRTKLAIVWADQSGTEVRKYSFYDLMVLSNRFANVLLELGCKKGDRLFIMVPRLIEWYAVMLGSFKLGVIPMPAPGILVPKDIAYRINQAEAVGAVIWHEYTEKLEAVRTDCPSLQQLISVGGEREGWHSYAELMAQAPAQLNRDVVEPTRADDNMLIYFTSGTTKFPKMVPHTQASYGIGHLITAKFWQDLKPTDLHWTLSDTGWAKAAWGKLFGQWQIGCAVMVHDAAGKFDARTHLQLIEKCGITTFCAPPTVYRMLVQEDLTQYNLSGLRHSLAAGEPLNPEIIKLWKRHTGTTIYDGFGQTESVNLIANFPCVPIRPGSMGKPTPGFHIELIDDEGTPVCQGEEGNIAVRVRPDPPVGLLHAYWRNDEANREAFRGDWYYTGDKAYQDVDGYFWFVGRSDDVINASGYRIGPFEVESALQSHPAVVESAVVGSPDPLRGTIVKAFIILAPSYSANPELVSKLQEHVKRETAPYKYPREIEFVSELPKTVSGKIRRVELRHQEAQNKIGAV